VTYGTGTWGWDYGTVTLGFVDLEGLGVELFQRKTTLKIHRLRTQMACDMPFRVGVGGIDRSDGSDGGGQWDVSLEKPS
jgi:hypothetical protein